MARILWGLDEQSCARDCNLHKARCLAFDVCRQSGRHLCILYSVRSPRESFNLRLPPLDSERLLDYGDDNDNKSKTLLIETTSEPQCEHFHLKRGYFAVRLGQMLHYEKRATELEHREDEQLDADRKASDEELKSIEEEERKLKAEYRLEAARGTGSASIGSIQWLALLLGSLLGCLATMYREPIVQLGRQSYSRFEASRRHGNDGLSELVLNEDA